MNKSIAFKRKFLSQENRKYGRKMVYVPEPWPEQKGVGVAGVWRSKDYLAQLVLEDRTKALRLTVQRTMINGDGTWVEGISWDELQRIKDEIGYGNHIAVEVYPRNKDVVNVANTRHLFFVAPDFEIGWAAPSETK